MPHANSTGMILIYFGFGTQYGNAATFYTPLTLSAWGYAIRSNGIARRVYLIFLPNG